MAAFQFEKKRELDICGRKYPCDISDVHMLEGVTRDFPRMLRAVQEFCNVSGRLNADAHDWRPTAPAAELVCEKGRALLDICRTFIEGTLGVDEYAEIFSGRRENINEHVSLCSYIYGEVMEGRREIVDQFLTPELKEMFANAAGGDAEAAGHDPGPELMHFAGGEAVYTAEQSRALMSAQGGGTTFVDNSQNIFKVDDIETYVAIKRMLENEKMTVRMGLARR